MLFYSQCVVVLNKDILWKFEQTIIIKTLLISYQINTINQLFKNKQYYIKIKN